MMPFLTMEIKYALMILGLSMTPILELRASIPYGFANGLPAWETIILSVIGNLILTPFIIVFFRRIIAWLKTVKSLRRFAEWSERRVLKKKHVIEKYEAIGLAIIVAIPFPGTGAWTGAMLAGILGMRLKKALPAIAIGVAVAAVIMTCVSYGIFSLA